MTQQTIAMLETAAAARVAMLAHRRALIDPRRVGINYDPLEHDVFCPNKHEFEFPLSHALEQHRMWVDLHWSSTLGVTTKRP